MAARRVFVISSARLTAHRRGGPELPGLRAIVSVPGSVHDLIAGAGI